MKKYILLIILISIGLTGKSQFDITAEVIQRKMSITIVVEDVQKPGFRNIAKIITEKEGVNGLIDVMSKAMKWGSINKVEKMDIEKLLGIHIFGEIILRFDFRGKDDGDWGVRIEVLSGKPLSSKEVGTLNISKVKVKSLLATFNSYKNVKTVDEVFN